MAEGENTQKPDLPRAPRIHRRDAIKLIVAAASGAALASPRAEIAPLAPLTTIDALNQNFLPLLGQSVRVRGYIWENPLPLEKGYINTVSLGTDTPVGHVQTHVGKIFDMHHLVMDPGPFDPQNPPPPPREIRVIDPVTTKGERKSRAYTHIPGPPPPSASSGPLPPEYYADTFMEYTGGLIPKLSPQQQIEITASVREQYDNSTCISLCSL